MTFYGAEIFFLIFNPTVLCIFSDKSFKRIEQHPALVGSLPFGAATRAFFYKTVFTKKKTFLVKSSARQKGS